MGEIQIGGVRLIGLSCDTRARETETFGECEAIGVTDERIHKQPDELPPSRVKPDWASFFALEIDVPEDFLAERDESPPQSRELLEPPHR